MVEIIPKPIKKASPWQGILLYFSIFFFIGVILATVVLFPLKNKAVKELQKIEDDIIKERTPEIISLEKEIQNYDKEIKDFKPLLDQHVLTSKILNFLESKTHPRIFFLRFNLNSKDSKVVLFGQTDSFLILGQQILILEKEPLIQNIDLSRISISKDGKIDFNLELSFDPTILKY